MMTTTNATTAGLVPEGDACAYAVSVARGRARWAVWRTIDVLPQPSVVAGRRGRRTFEDSLLETVLPLASGTEGTRADAMRAALAVAPNAEPIAAYYANGLAGEIKLHKLRQSVLEDARALAAFVERNSVMLEHFRAAAKREAAFHDLPTATPSYLAIRHELRRCLACAPALAGAHAPAMHAGASAEVIVGMALRVLSGRLAEDVPSVDLAALFARTGMVA